MNYKKITNILENFLSDEFKKANYKNAIVGLSGGLDSAIVATLCKSVFKNNFKAVLMPSEFSNDVNTKDSIKMCKKLGIDYEIIKIDNFINSYKQNLSNSKNDDNNSKIRIGNFCARIRMMILYDLSSKYNSLVVGTSNKSELMLGYGTMFGDLACAINPLSNFYKSDLFDYGKYLGVASNIINKAPSADLGEGQSDEIELGFSYKDGDNALKYLLKEIDKKEFNGSDELLNKVKNKVNANKFKANGVITLDSTKLDKLF
jgi:NAD+ synthase